MLPDHDAAGVEPNPLLAPPRSSPASGGGGLSGGLPEACAVRRPGHLAVENHLVGGEAVIGNSPNANGIVNVTGPNAIFLSTARDITVGNQGTVHFSDNDCGSWDR